MITETNYEATRLASATPQNELIGINESLTPVPIIVHEETTTEEPINNNSLSPSPIHDPRLTEIKPNIVDSDTQITHNRNANDDQNEEIEQVVEIKPKNPYVNQIKSSNQQTVEKIVEYYVPIVQDIDGDKGKFNF